MEKELEKQSQKFKASTDANKTIPGSVQSAKENLQVNTEAVENPSTATPSPPTEEKKTPTLFEWMGGREALLNLLENFYAKVRKDELLAPLFKDMSDDHHVHVAMWFEEVFGGEPRYTNERGGFKTMLRQHRGRSIQTEQRQRWISLMLQAADEVNLPSDPEFRSAFTGYIEWGSRRAQANSQPDAKPSKRTSVPRWGWGEAPPGTP